MKRGSSTVTKRPPLKRWKGGSGLRPNGRLARAFAIGEGKCARAENPICVEAREGSRRAVWTGDGRRWAQPPFDHYRGG